jgi:hypothetical protein
MTSGSLLQRAPRRRSTVASTLKILLKLPVGRRAFPVQQPGVAKDERAQAQTDDFPFVLGYAGLLDGKRAATHWEFEQDFQRRFPQVRLPTISAPLFRARTRLSSSACGGRRSTSPQ